VAPHNPGPGGAAAGWETMDPRAVVEEEESRELPAVQPNAGGSPTWAPTGAPRAATGAPAQPWEAAAGAGTVPPGSTLPPGTTFPPGMTGLPAPGRSRLLPWLVIGALLILVVILLGALNLRDYHLINDGDQMVVRRGGWVLFTTRELPEDEIGPNARYEPLALPPNMPRPPDRRFSEREDLDRAMIGIILKLLSAALAGQQEARVEALGQRLDAFPAAGVILEDPVHRMLMRRVGTTRARMAERQALERVIEARALYKRYDRRPDAAGRRAIRRLSEVESLISGERPEDAPEVPGEEQPANDGVDF
jgi:hypothetical protein